MRKDPYAKERAEMQIKLKKGDSSVNRFFDVLMESAKGEPGHTPLKGKDYWTKEERAEMVAEITALIPVPKDADEVDYDLVLSYVTQEVEKRVSEEVAKIPPAERGLPGKDAVVDIPAIVESLLKVMPKMESTEVDYLGVKEYIDKQITSIKAEPRVIKQFTGGGATSLKQLTDVVLDGLSQDSKGNYILSGGGSVSDEVYSGTWDGVTDEAPSKNAVYDKIQSLSLGAGAGDVVGPISSINNRIVTFDGITGKLIKDSGSVVGDFATASHNHTGVYEPADATILKDADIGVSVASQSHNHTGVYEPALGADDNYVTDAEKTIIASTTASYTTADATKIGNISVTQAVDLDAIETRVNALDASVVLSGLWDASAGTFPGGGTAQAGFSYIVSVGGTVDGQVFVENDRIVAIFDNASTTVYASNWHKLDYTDAVLSVAGRAGAVSLTVEDITGTKAQFNTAVTDGDIMYVGDAPTSHTHLLAVGATDVTASASEVNILDGATLTVTELNYVDGVTSAIQTQLDTKVSATSTNTLTNKRITPRTGTTTSSATPTINTDNVDEYYITAQAVDITSMTTNLSGTPTLGQLLYISIKGTAARAITWGASFANGAVALPTTTTTTLELMTLFKWNGTAWTAMATGSTV